MRTRALILLAPIALVLAAACGIAARPLATPSIARETGFVTVQDGARIYFEAAGNGPAILFIHGLGGNHAAWFHQIPYFARTHRAVTISQRGFAPSTGGERPYDVALLVQDAVAVLEKAGAKDVVVVGQSMGGWTALGLAIERPDLVRGVVLSGTVAGIFDAEIERHYATVTERARALADRPPALGQHPAISSRFTERSPDEAYLYQLLTSFGAPTPSTIAAALGNSRFDDTDLVRLRAPVLFVVGEDDVVFPPAIVQRAADRIPGARLVVIPDAGHSPYFERPEAWNDAVRAELAGDRGK
jgi:pimeloyl-ACP methyl ester carboxylesterase